MWNSHRPKTADNPTRKVSFSDSSKSDTEKKEDGRPASASGSPSKTSSTRSRSASQHRQWSDTRTWQRINRQSELLWQPASIISPTIPQAKPFLIYNDAFLSILGPSPTLQVLIDDSREPFFHEAGVFHARTNTLFITSNLCPDHSPDAVTRDNKTIIITKIEFFSPTDFTRDKVRYQDHRNFMPNGGTNYRDGIIFCAQGSLSEPAGLMYMEAKRPHKTTTLLNNYHSRPFNSPNDVVVHSDGTIWFTDPIYGYEQGIRPKPQLPQHVYRFDPASGDIRVVADGFGRPNGICFSPGEETVYISDTDLVHGSHAASPHINPQRAATIYAFSIFHDKASSQPFLTNRRVFAYADSGAPDGVKCDILGNVYAGCGDGINVWNSGGVLVGKIQIEGGVANFCFGKSGEMWVFGETKLWRVKLADETKGALLGI